MEFSFKFALGNKKANTAPRAAGADGGVLIATPDQLAEALQTGSLSESGERVTRHTALGIATVFGCVRIRSGAIANMPIDIKRRVDDKTRVDASDHPLWTVLRRRPNRWQKPAQFKRMMEMGVLLDGNAYALKVISRGKVIELIPLDNARMVVSQNDDLSIKYEYTHRNGRKIIFDQKEIFHLTGMTLDGVRGLSPIGYARETMGVALSMERHGAKMFKNGAQVSGSFSTDKSLSATAYERLKGSISEHTSEGGAAGHTMLLEEGLEFKRMALSAVDAQWIEARKLTRTDIGMFYGVPPFLLGDTEKSTSWGTGLEQQSRGFVTFALEDSLTMWEEAINADCLGPEDSEIFARFNRNSLVRGDLKARWEAYTKSLQWGVNSPDEIRAMEDENPRPDGRGGVFYDPPNTAGGESDDETKDTDHESD